MKLLPATTFHSFPAASLLSNRWPQWFDSLFNDGVNTEGTALLPPVDVTDDTAHYIVQVELPGVKKEDLKVELHGDTLSIAATRKRGEATVQFSRSLSLPEGISAEGISAELKDGLLTIQVPKAAEKQPRQIAIQ